MAKLNPKKVVPEPPDLKASHFVRWLYHAVFPEIDIHANDNDAVCFNSSTLLGKAVLPPLKLPAHETSCHGGIQVDRTHTYCWRPRLQKHWPMSYRGTQEEAASVRFRDPCED